MIALGIDTSTFALSLGIVENQKIICELYYNKEIPSGEMIPILIQDIVKESDLCLGEIDLFACSVGPGSFTGLRVGIAAVKGLSFALQKPCCGIPTLDGLVSKFIKSFKMIVPLLDAREERVYTTIYANGKKSFPVVRMDVHEIIGKIEKETLFLGNGAARYKDIIVNRLGERAHFLTPNIDSPSGSDIAYCGILSYGKGENPPLEPIYLTS